MELSEKDNSIITDMICKFFQNSNNSSELEFRIGKFREGFKSQNDPEIFYKIKNVYKNYYSHKIIKTSETNFIKETTFNEKTRIEKIKKIIQDDENIEHIVKTPLRVYNIYDYDMKISIENEKKISEDLYNQLCVEKNITNKTKTRISFFLNENMRLDLTVVRYNGISEYQIELEIIKTPKVDLDILIKNIFKHLNTILQYKQKNYYVISNKEKNNILTEYSQLVKNRYFIGAQPETLHFEHLNLLRKQYLLTYKADGERGLLFINKDSEIYILDNNLDNLMKTNIKHPSIKSSVLDVEIIKTETKIILLVFDVLFFNQKDLRNDILLLDRLALIKNIDYENDIYKIKQKPYVDNFQIGIDLMLQNIDTEYKKDGLIFVPLNEPYPQTKKWKTLLKWKPQEKNSIDFYVKQKGQTDKGIIYNLYINNPENKDDKLELFKTESSESLQDLINVDSIKDWTETKKSEITWETIIYNNEFDPDTRENYLDETVIEFYWSFEENRFIPIKTRWDKLNNPAKWGNNISVAKDIWKSIKNPVKLGNIKTINNCLKNQNLFTNMRKYHNQIKNNLYKSITKNHPKPKLIELCSGRGGDVNKWMFNEVSSVLGFDISKTNIEECYKRLEKYENKFQYKFIEKDLTSECLIEELEHVIVEEYDSIVCHFGIHYMFKNQRSITNFLEICEKYLKQDGLIVLTFVDSERLLKLKNKWAIENNILLHYIDYKNINKESLWGNEISMYLNGENILSTISNEYLVNIEMFKELLKQDYSVLEQKNFSELQGFNNLENYEKTISELYSYIVIKKNKKTQDDLNINILNKPNTINIPEYFNEINYYLNDKAFKLFKITTETDFEFVNNLHDYNHSADLKFLEIEYGLERLNSLKKNIKNIISNYDDNKIIFKIRFIDSEFELFYLYTDNDYNTSLENKKEITDNVSKLIDIMIGSIITENKPIENDKLYPNLSKLKLEELKSMAKELKLPVSGKKVDLIERIKVKIEKKN